MTGLVAEIDATVGTLHLDVRVSVDDGETLAVLGPNGAGKTTLLRALAGLIAPSRGSVVVDGRPWDRLPPEQRAVGFVFQDHRLFPHLSVGDNVAYGLRRRRVRRVDAHRRAAAWLERVGLAGLEGARPAELSGGQRQRVALARALAVEPDVLLLDEPLAALDVATRAEVRRELRTHLDGFAGVAVLVSHDPLDAVALAERVAILEDGRIVQEGSAFDVTSHPRSTFAAAVAGTNLFHGVGDGDRVRVADGFDVVVPEPVAGDVFVGFHPSAVALHLAEPEGSARNVWAGVVDGVDHRGTVVRVVVRVAGEPVVAEVTAAAVASLRLEVGRSVWVAVKATEVHVDPA